MTFSRSSSSRLHLENRECLEVAGYAPASSLFLMHVFPNTQFRISQLIKRFFFLFHSYHGGEKKGAIFYLASWMVGVCTKILSIAWKRREKKEPFLCVCVLEVRSPSLSLHKQNREKEEVRSSSHLHVLFQPEKGLICTRKFFSIFQKPFPSSSSKGRVSDSQKKIGFFWFLLSSIPPFQKSLK